MPATLDTTRPRRKPAITRRSLMPSASAMIVLKETRGFSEYEDIGTLTAPAAA
jgi:hypothetical protein